MADSKANVRHYYCKTTVLPKEHNEPAIGYREYAIEATNFAPRNIRVEILAKTDEITIGNIVYKQTAKLTWSNKEYPKIKEMFNALEADVKQLTKTKVIPLVRIKPGDDEGDRLSMCAHINDAKEGVYAQASIRIRFRSVIIGGHNGAIISAVGGNFVPEEPKKEAELDTLTKRLMALDG
jgi:hypothetical protein